MEAKSPTRDQWRFVTKKLCYQASQQSDQFFLNRKEASLNFQCKTEQWRWNKAPLS